MIEVGLKLISAAVTFLLLVASCLPPACMPTCGARTMPQPSSAQAAAIHGCDMGLANSATQPKTAVRAPSPDCCRTHSPHAVPAIAQTPEAEHQSPHDPASSLTSPEPHLPLFSASHTAFALPPPLPSPRGRQLTILRL